MRLDLMGGTGVGQSRQTVVFCPPYRNFTDVAAPLHRVEIEAKDGDFA
jgi:hypothetical protein